jgi:hypothetical protein
MGDVIKLQNLQDAKTCEGCGAVGFKGSQAPGIEVFYVLDKGQVEKLKAHNIVKVRIYTSEGYLENDIKDKVAQKIIASLNLL